MWEVTKGLMPPSETWWWNEIEKAIWAKRQLTIDDRLGVRTPRQEY